MNRRSALAGYRDIFPPDAPPPTEDEVLAQWSRWLGPDWELGHRAFVAELDDVVGVVLAGPDSGASGVGRLARLYVDPTHWARGIGRQLHDAAVDHLRSQGYTTARLWVLEHNQRARSWYERLGWQADGTRKPVYAPANIDDVGYRMRLER